MANKKLTAAERTAQKIAREKAQRAEQEKIAKQINNRILLKKALIIGAVVIGIVSTIVIALTVGGGLNRGKPGQYGRIIEGNPTVIDIGSVDCVPCKLLQPALINLGKKHDGSINFLFYDSWYSEEGKAKARQYNVSGIPTLIFLNGNGSEVARMVSFSNDPQKDIEDKMRSLGWI